MKLLPAFALPVCSRAARTPRSNTTCCCAAATSSTPGTRSSAVARRGHPRRQDRRGGPEDRPGDGAQDGRRRRPVRDPGPDRHPRPRLRRHRASGAPTPATTASIPDGFTFRSGVTTVADAGCAGWRNFEEFKATGHRPLAGPASSRSSTSSATGCAAAGSSRTSRTWRPGRRPRWRCATRA